MELTFRERGWTKPFVQGNSVFHYLLFKVEGATGGHLQVQLDDAVFWRVNPVEPHPDPETFTDRVTLLVLGRLGALGRERVDELLGDNQRHPTYAISIDERDADELRRLPGAKVCRWSSMDSAWRARSTISPRW